MKLASFKGHEHYAIRTLLALIAFQIQLHRFLSTPQLHSNACNPTEYNANPPMKCNCFIIYFQRKTTNMTVH